MNAARSRIAVIIGARVPIIAVRRVPQALAVLADIVRGALVAIIAMPLRLQKHATLLRIATIGGTRIIVITVHLVSARDANAVIAILPG